MRQPRQLSLGYQRMDNRVTGKIVDAIVIQPRSSGQLSLPGGYSTASPPPAHRVLTQAAGPEGVSYEKWAVGSDENYHIVYVVQNHRDSPSFAQIELVEGRS